MKNGKKTAALYKFNLFSAFSSASFYILSLLYAILIPLNFFIRHQFFISGSSDLTLFFSDVPYICIIIIPALCYKQSYSIYEDFVPVSILNKILARFASVFTQFFIMNLLLLPSIFLVNLFGSTDAGQIFTSFIILLCYGSAVCAASILISEIISNKVSAFVVSSLILAILNAAHLFVLYTSTGAFLTDLFKQISFAWHFDAASKGIFDTRDLIWLLALSLLFILLSELFSQIKKGKTFSFTEKLRIAGRLFLIILIMFNGKVWYKQFDFSQSKSFTLSKYTKNLLKKIDSPVKITYFRSQSLARLYPQIRDVSDFLNIYADQSKEISFIVKNPDSDEKTKTLLQNYGIMTQSLRSVSGTSTEFTNVYSAIVIEYKGNAETIQFTMDSSTLEYDLDGRIKHLLSENRRNVQIVVGNGMNLYDDYEYVVPWLNAQGFECNVLDINSASFSDELLSLKGPLFVIGDSEIPIEKAIAIEDYILSENGNALLAVSPYQAAIDDNWYITQNKKTNLVEMIENWGITFLPEITADISCARITMSSDDNSETSVINYPMWLSLLPQENAKVGANLFWTTPLQLSGAAKPYLVTTQAAYTYAVDTHSSESIVENNPFLLAEDKSLAEKERGTRIVAASVSGKLDGLYNLNSSSNSTVIVIPDQYFINTLMQQYLGESNDFKNFHLLTNILLNLNGEEELAELYSRGHRDTSLYKTSDLPSKTRLLFVILFVLIPLLIILSGILNTNLKLLSKIMGKNNEKK